MARSAVLFFGMLLPLLGWSQGGDQQLRAKADVLFAEKRFGEAMPLYSQLVSLTPGDRDLNYRYGTCILFGGTDKEKAIGHLKYATEAPSTDPRAWYWLGRAYHLNYHFREAQAAYQRFLGTDDKKAIAEWPVDALQKQCRNGEKLLNNLKEISVRNKVEVDDKEFFRFYDLSDIGGKIVVLPEELKSALDKKSKERTLVYLPERGGPIYFSSYGKDGRTGRDIYRTELMPEGTFAPPVKLAGYINTDQDEDFPFMHPDGKTFYFSSKGHNSMGGYDVFRAPYDRSLDAFGRPENLDFAVNTPDDDIFYLVDPEGKEACFASARSSRQGQVHVYRVATAQLPLVITVLKGTYASAFDANDRKARIMVEDALTGEQVADVRTDLNGGYVLSLPRSGRYRYKVECGPTGKTHGGIVEVPRSEGPKAYRQELSLVRNGDQERLEIRNYFDTPLDDDIVALALDEIKRRARLDVTGDRPVVPPPAEVPAPKGDVLTQAGFSGDVDEKKVLELARDDAAELERTAEELSARSNEAFSLALEATSEAERTAKQAEERIAVATATSDEAERNAAMVEAARIRQRSREATLRAQAAYSTGVALGNEATNTRQQAATAQRLSTDLQGTMTAKRDSETLVHLTALKQRLDTRSGPEGSMDATEKARRALSAQEKEAGRLLNIANGKRAEENELADQLNRVKREQADAKGKGRKDELQLRIDELQAQLTAQRKETEMAFAKARAEEKRTAVMRGQTSLTRHLSTAGGRGAGTELTAAQVAALGQRIESTDREVETMPIDERFDAQLAVSGTEVESRTFDWELVSAAGGIGAPPEATQAMARTTTGDAQQASTRSSTVAPSPTGERTVHPGGQVPTVVTAGNEDGGSGHELARQEPGNAQGEQGLRVEQPGAATQAGAIAGAVVRTEGNTEAQGTSGVQEEVDPVPTSESTSAATQFVLENKRDELRQLVQAERNRTRKDSLQGALTAVEQQLADMEARAAVTEAAPPEDAASEEALDEVPIDPARTPLLFDRQASAQEILPQLYADYTRDKARLQELTDADERAAGLNGLELMMADSIRSEMARQVKLLELAPQRAEEILPRVARLRELRNEQLHLADQHLKDRQNELALSGAEGMKAQGTGSGQSADATLDPVNDRFVALAPYATDVYESKLEHRARNIEDAVAFKDADLARIDDLTTRIDSMEAMLAEAPRDKSYERVRKEADRLIDERLIIRTDLGQRSAYLTKEEWKAATDSLKGLDKAITTKGFAPTEPLLIMAQDLRTTAQAEFDKAAQLRKRADRIDDIVLRDSLYRSAYRTELEGLRQIDRSITVRAYLVGSEHQRGETLTYEVVAERMFGTPDAEPVAGPATVAQVAPVEQGAGIDSVGVTTEAASNGHQEGTAVGTERDIRPESAASSMTTASAQAQQQAPEVQDTERPAIAAAPVVAPTATLGGADVQAARTEAERIAAEAERQLPAQQRSPAALYERFLGQEAGTLSAMEVEDPGMDPALLSVKAEGARHLAAEQEQEALRNQDLATAYTDSMATARKRDRERLERMAVRTRAAADSLQSASLASAQQARDLELAAKAAEASSAYRQRLVKYYYLTSEEQALAIDSADHSRYFQARTRALEQYDAADEAARAAAGNREVAGILRVQARTAETDASSGRMPAAVAVERMTVLDRRADALLARADSLDDVARRLRGAAAINEAQAGVMLQGLGADRSTDIMALEMRTRRTEPMLAGTRNPVPASTGQAQAQQHPRTAGGAQNGSSTSTVAQRSATTTPAARSENVPVVEPAVQANVQPIARTEAPVVAPGTSTARTADPAPVVRDASPAERMGTRLLPEVLVADIFQMQPTTDHREEPIPMDVDLPQGIVFKVQIGAFRNEVSQEAFSDMSPVMGETVGNGLVRYTAGLFVGFEQAANAKDLVRARGYRDAFVVAYRDGQRIPLGEAMRASREQQAETIATRPASAIPVARQETAAPITATIQPAPVPAPLTAVEETAQILERYPATAEAIVATFAPAPDAASYYAEVPNAAPARQVETIQGLFFTVQVGVYSKPVPLDKLFNITPLNSELTETRKVRYTTGIFLDMDKVRTRKDETVTLGVKDAFITAYLNGRRIPMREATALLEKFGPAILARP